MVFQTLKEKCEYYRSLTDYKLLPNGYILVMIDGKNFSKLIKNKFNKPFDNWFIETMNQTAIYVAKSIQGCTGAFVQSDEISFIIKDDATTTTPFSGRMCKLLSIIPSIATSFFLKRIITLQIEKGEFIDTNHIPDYVFDCKVWNVPNGNEARAWFIYRQNDCIRNSKQQFAQTYLPCKDLVNLDSNKQIELCELITDNDWNTLSDDKKYGRFIYRKWETIVNSDNVEYKRYTWEIGSFLLDSPENREKLYNLFSL